MIVTNASTMRGCTPQTSQDRMSVWAAGFFRMLPSERSGPTRIAMPASVLPVKSEGVADWINERGQLECEDEKAENERRELDSLRD